MYNMVLYIVHYMYQTLRKGITPKKTKNIQFRKTNTA